ncbi:COX15/CtaA family protein [Dyadobacter fanqingshengii]|uniref:COX15/CtaA family protein n=1 Tax=Dyadobacter fanqingshengii TaxID=2906443 RepID=A0A9X1PEA4_9BACT|nr:COX15/CtaA family protein [Dyadobacter fanqingshengii]MCF0042283.1 COX15/CtaA family protein [Dyadobacter fanqingshengii]USJ35188.1 COX15/CtaA family protein [Dyadobacter fanqingshengii]
MTSSTHIDIKANRRFRRLALNTVIVLYFLIIAGGVVRSTGAGMGCPDWPRCFGRWVPPTEVSQLPANYKELYGAKLKGEIEFNPVKTWIEYVNRLLGAFTGVMIFLTLLASIPFLRSGNKRIFYYSLSAFILVGFQGWLGAKVVSFELLPIVVTLHMLLAIVIVFLLLYLFTWSAYAGNILQLKESSKKAIGGIGVVVITLSLIQILLGTQVREAMDEVIQKLGYQARSEWIDELGLNFYIHRSFSILVFVVNLYWINKIFKAEGKGSIAGKIAIACFWILILEIGTGILMAYFGVPPFAQPLHLTFAILLIGLQFVIWLVVNGKKYLKYSSDIRLAKSTI